ARLEKFGNSDFVTVQSRACIREQRSRNAHPVRVTAGHERSSRGRADSLGYIEVGQPNTLARHAIDVGRLVAFSAKATQISVTHVIEENDHEVGRPLCYLWVPDSERKEEQLRKTVQKSSARADQVGHGFTKLCALNFPFSPFQRAIWSAATCRRFSL